MGVRHAGARFRRGEVALLPRVHRITKYDPAHRDRRGYHTGPENTASDHGPAGAAYPSAIAVLAGASGVDHPQIREPGLFAEPVDLFPYDASLDEGTGEPGSLTLPGFPGAPSPYRTRSAAGPRRPHRPGGAALPEHALSG